jgi:hypothetical protein
MFHTFWTKFLLTGLALAVAFTATLSVFAANARAPESGPAFVWSLTATTPKAPLDEATTKVDSGWIDRLYWTSCALDPAGYSFRIRSRNPYGESEWSSVHPFTAYDDYPVLLPIIFR